MGKYLSCPVFQGKSKPSTFANILGKATARMEAWKANSLSKAGRVVLVQSNLKFLPTYTMQCFELPKKTTSQLNRVNKRFFLEEI